MNHQDEKERLNSTGEIYTREAGQLNRDIASYYTLKITKQYSDRGIAVQLGLGDGFIASAMAQNFERFVVLEGSSAVINSVQNLPEKIEVVETLFEDFRVNDVFDWVFGHHVLEHVQDPGKIARLVLKWLKPGGHAIFTVPNAASLHRRIGVEMGLLSRLDELHEQDVALGHRRVYFTEDLQNQIKEAGFEVIAAKGYMLKLVSQRQMKDWSRDLLDACFALSLSLSPEMCSNIFILAQRPK